MHIKKYDFNYGRRLLLQKVAVGATAGVLMPLWPMIARGADNISKVYPEELLHIEAYTKGKVKPGDVITADNVDIVKDLLDPVAYQQVKTMGRRINIVESTTDVTKLFSHDYLEATLKNKGRAILGADGNVWDKTEGTPWCGGNPFPEAKDGVEATANLTLCWGRHDYSQYAVRDWDISPGGDIAYQYDFVWSEFNTTARLDGKTWGGKKDLLRYQSVFFTSPHDTAGTAFLNTWPYDQRKFPELKGYLPVFRRVRDFPTNQRFEPLVPGMTLFLSDAWAAGDPMLTWGNYKIVERKPMLGAIGGRNFMGGYNDNWERPVHGGPKNQTFHDVWMELVPEVIVVDAEPVGYPRAPVGKKRTWIDVRNGMYIAYNTYDRRGKIWKSFEPQYALYSNDKMTVKDANGHPIWSFVSVLSHDIQANRMSRFGPARQVNGGYKTNWGEGSEDVYNKYLTVQAIQRLGAD
jgi:hypothetical protein